MSVSVSLNIYGGHFEYLISQHKIHMADLGRDQKWKEHPNILKKKLSAHFYLEMPTSFYLSPFSQILPSLEVI